jgi:hypothetical protein
VGGCGWILLRAAKFRVPSTSVTSPKTDTTIHEIDVAGYARKLKGFNWKQGVVGNEQTVTYDRRDLKADDR